MRIRCGEPLLNHSLTLHRGADRLVEREPKWLSSRIVLRLCVLTGRIQTNVCMQMHGRRDITRPHSTKRYLLIALNGNIRVTVSIPFGVAVTIDMCVSISANRLTQFTSNAYYIHPRTHACTRTNGLGSHAHRETNKQASHTFTHTYTQ